LIAIVESDEYRVVQFSHFSVKEYLTSARLATSSGDISRYHIDPVPAHKILAQASMAVLLQSDDRVEDGGGENISPLTGYAAKHWVVHAHDQKVSSCIRKAMEYLFDVDKPYFAAWLKLYDIDTRASEGSTFYWFAHGRKSGATPLYYAARFGFQDLVEHLVACDPKQVNATGGYYVTPFVAALAAGHFHTAEFLYQKGAHPNIRGLNEATPLHSAAYYGDFEMVQILLKYKADVHARNAKDKTPLDFILEGPYVGDPNSALSLSNVTRLLLEHGADRAQEKDRSTALHFLAGAARFDVAVIRVMLEGGVDVNARKDDDTTPLHEAAQNGRVEAMRVLLEHGADVNVRKNDDTTPLHQAAQNWVVEATRVLLEHGADVNARKNDDTTPLHQAAQNWSVEAMRVLLEHGADANARKNDDTTPLHEAAQNEGVELMRVLLEHGADVNARKNDGSTLLHVAAQYGMTDNTRELLKHGANVGAEDGCGRTASQVASEEGHYDIMTLFSEHGAR
jgi:cytohesin